jgi:hypothetical protein
LRAFLCAWLQREGFAAGRPKIVLVPSDLARMLLRKGLGSMTSSRSDCSKCRRTPLPGELLHVLESERAVCSLCLRELPEAEQHPVRSERVHASERHIAVVPRAA